MSPTEAYWASDGDPGCVSALVAEFPVSRPL